MPEPAHTGTKRKRPPTFQHHPRNRAVALKKAWVEKAKIKSKWKAEKRKESLISNAKLELPEYDDDDTENNRVNGRREAIDEEIEKIPQDSPQKQKQKVLLHPSRVHIHSALPVKQFNISKSEPESSESRPAKKQKTSPSTGQSGAGKSLRELERDAYSKATLHTYKSDPLKKRRSALQVGPKGQALTGTGQPNMRLRMNAMLERIKQNYT